MKSAALIRELEAAGWRLDRVRGSRAALARAAGESRSGYIAHLTLEGPKRAA